MTIHSTFYFAENPTNQNKRTNMTKVYFRGIPKQLQQIVGMNFDSMTF